jgi:bifunctional UDP-N-acetylglucosamine pyrophosphorylase/glucosamine-1-phosphate N-acetyltransferase
VVEQKDCTPAQLRLQECNAGVYLVKPQFLWKSLAQTKSANAQREFYLTDLIELAAAKGKVAWITVPAEEASGVNDRAELAECGRILQLRINTRHMKGGVTLEDPRTTWIAEGVEIGADTEVGPAVSILGRSRIGGGVSIGQGSVLLDSEIAEGTQIRAYSVLEDAKVGRSCIIGPFARLRPGTQLEEAVHIGNFVETKKARIGRGSKANHLSYLGDAEIGAGVNVGAGTITCNYDGVKKHRTVLGDRVFVGSDTQLVAPVTVGDGAYIGAGTTVTKDVPAGSLALSRAPQVIKEGWVARKKAKDGAPAGGTEKEASRPAAALRKQAGGTDRGKR